MGQKPSIEGTIIEMRLKSKELVIIIESARDY